MAKLTAGMLIIGSLYWDDGKNGIRKKWRKERLEMGTDSEFLVKVPIRYGRKSSKRCNTYTMVFSPRCSQSDELGSAKVIPCKNPISSIEDLKEEARELWKAEAELDCDPPQHKGRSRISAKWGCVALLVNPNSHVEPELLDEWAEFVAEERNRKPQCVSLEGARDEGCLVSNGLLRILWPELESGSGPLPDILLATATKPEPMPIPDYPSEEDIANEWIANGHVYYFWCNYESGIRTFWDPAIKRLLDNAGCVEKTESCGQALFLEGQTKCADKGHESVD